MDEETPYRLVLALVAVVQNTLARRHLRGARVLRSVFQRRDEGIPLTLALAGLLLAYCTAVVAWLVNPAWMAWAAVALPAALRWLGLLPLAPGVALLVAGAKHLGSNFTLSVSTVEHHALVTSGPYAWVRHPLYAGLLLGSVGAALLSANAAVAATGVGMWGLLAYRTRLEEENLVARFGDAYRDYQRRVGRFVPRAPR